MALTESDIKIIIAAELKKQGFENAKKATNELDKRFKMLGKTVLGVFSAQQIVSFGKASVRAFMQDEAAAARLTKTVANLGLGFEDARIKQFISDLEKASGVSDTDLRPAFQSLISTTGSVSKAQKLLGTAIDAAIGSGENLTTVSQDLSNAFIGNVKGLKKYNLGLTQTELSAMSFEDIVKRLNERFSGANAAYLDTYAGKLSLLRVAFDNMQETIGKGLLDAFQILGGDQGIGGTTSAMEKFGDAVANTTRGVVELISQFKNFQNYGKTVVDFIKYFDPLNPIGSAVGFIGQMGKVKPAPFNTPMTISGSLDSQKKIEAARKKAEADAAKRAKELLALTKKQVKAQEALNKKKQEEGILGEIAKRFDMERIQIAAALSGQVGEVERLRLELMQALLDEDVKRAVILEGQLIKAEAAAAELANLLDSLDTMVGDPFADWPGTIKHIQELLSQLKIKVPIETLFAEKGLKLDQNAMTVTRLERMDVNANNVYVNGTLNGNIQTPVMPGGSALPDLPPDWEKNPIIAPAVNAAADAAAAEAEAAAALALIEAEAAARALAEYEADQALKALFAQLGLDESGNPITVNVTVEGSLISQNDLVEQITDDIYRIQKTGKRITLSSLEI